jgi:hypothetical protein
VRAGAGEGDRVAGRQGDDVGVEVDGELARGDRADLVALVAEQFAALDIVFLKFWPSMASLETHKFAGLSALGYISYAILWVVQGAVFWKGMGAIRRFIDWAGPAVYVVMIVLCIYLVTKAGWSHLSLNLSSGPGLDPLHTFYTTINSTALVVAYFAGPMLNFGDFARYGKSLYQVILRVALPHAVMRGYLAAQGPGRTPWNLVNSEHRYALPQIKAGTLPYSTAMHRQPRN